MQAGDRSLANIKWHRELGRRFDSKTQIAFDPEKVTPSLYRPFSTKFMYFDRLTNSQSFRLHDIFRGEMNRTIAFLGVASANPLTALASDRVFDTCLLKNGNGSTQGAPRYRYTKSGERVDNITDWALNKFVKRYGKRGVTKDSIFHYVYAVLHDPVYRETYALNLKREFPRIPYYADFAQWAAWGQSLIGLHTGYEDVVPWPVQRTETPSKSAAGTHPKPILKSQAERGLVIIDAETQIAGIPPEAWSYRLGNRSAIDWVLDQHKEKRPRDDTIAANFNTYRFADYKERMISLLAKVARVSVETTRITAAMTAIDRTG
ncbi:type ISP restriction/modification enzyme [Mesorhizobium sp. A623]